MASLGNYSMIPLMGRPPEIDLGKTMLTAGALRGQDTSNALAQYGLTQQQDRNAALADYAARQQRGDPAPEAALAKYPDLVAQVVDTRNKLSGEERTAFDHRTKLLHQEATSLLPVVNTPQFAPQWQAAMDRLYKAGAIDEGRYKQWRENPSQLALQQVINLTSGLQGHIQQEQLRQGDQFTKTLGGMLGGNQQTPAGPTTVPAAPPAGPAAPSNLVRAAQPNDNYQRTLFQAESGNKNIPNRSGPNGTPASSAFGPGQFLESTWAGLIKQHPDLNFTMADRMKPEAQAIMETRFRAGNAAALASAGIDPNDKNLYMAHFLGADGARQFMKGLEQSPSARGIDLVPPGVATSNRTVFYNQDGSPKGAQQVYNALTRKFGDTSTGITSPQVAQQIATQMPQGMTIGGVPAAQMIPFLAQASSNNMLPEPQRKTAETLLKAALEEVKPTNSIREYQVYQQQELGAGRVPEDFTTWDRKNKAAARSQVNVTNTEETAEAKARGTENVKRYGKIADDGNEALENRQLVGRLGELLSQSPTGPAVGFTEWVRGHTGINLGPKGGTAEAITALQNYLTPRMRVAGSGATSDKDMAIYFKSLAGMLNSPEGQRMAIETLGGMYQYRIDRAEIANEYMNGDIDSKTASKRIRELGNPFDRFIEWQEARAPGTTRLSQKTKKDVPATQAPQELPSVSTEEELAEAIKSGKYKSGNRVRLPSGDILTIGQR